jgi:ribosomal protein S12 methylthiotransferase
MSDPGDESMPPDIPVHSISLGCPKNRIDTEHALASIAGAAGGGMRIVENQESARVILINTCGFIQASVEESIEAILDAAAGKRDGQLLVVTGCLVERYGSELAKELPEADILVGVAGYGDIGRRILRAIEPEAQIAGTEGHGRIITTPPWRTYVKISEGCSNRCAYCLIPSIRGRQVCRPPGEIVAEINMLVETGVREVTLVAQDLTAYAFQGARLPDLLAAIVAETDLPWLRMLYLYPSRIDMELVETVAEHGRICPYFDMPLQHASDKVLEAMNRGYSRGAISEVVHMIRSNIPDAFLRTTVITGFPGEGAGDFEKLMDFVREHRFDHLGCFPYSDEEGTTAFGLPDKVDKRLAEERHDRIMEAQQVISAEKLEAIRGGRFDVLVEGVSRETDLLLEGRTMFQAPGIDGVTYISDGEARPGDIVEVEIDETHIYDIAGRMV